MLSPSMRTMSKGNLVRAAAICCPTSYSGFSPVPLSPRTANFSESGRVGSGSTARAAFCSAGVSRAVASHAVMRTSATRRMVTLSFGCNQVDALRLSDPFAQNVDKSRGHVRRITTRSERILPLAFAQAADERGRPAHVLARDAAGHQFLMLPVIVELDKSALLPGDELRAGEDIEVVPLRRDATCPSKSKTEITHHVQVPRRRAGCRRVLVQRVVGVLEIRAVEHQQDDQQSLVWPLSDKGVLLPRPFALTDERRQVQAEAASAFDMDTRFVAHRERLEVVDGRLVIAERGEDAREHDFGRPFVAVMCRWLFRLQLAYMRLADADARVAVAGL